MASPDEDLPRDLALPARVAADVFHDSISLLEKGLESGGCVLRVNDELNRLDILVYDSAKLIPDLDGNDRKDIRIAVITYLDAMLVFALSNRPTDEILSQWAEQMELEEGNLRERVNYIQESAPRLRAEWMFKSNTFVKQFSEIDFNALVQVQKKFLPVSDVRLTLGSLEPTPEVAPAFSFSMEHFRLSRSDVGYLRHYFTQMYEDMPDSFGEDDPDVDEPDGEARTDG